MHNNEQKTSVPGGAAPTSNIFPDSIDGRIEVSVAPVVRENIGKCILVIGVGGAGGNTVEYMYRSPSPHVEYCAINTDLQDLEKLTIPNKFKIGAKLTGSLGAGGSAANGRDALLEDEDRINEYLEKVITRQGDDQIEMVYIVGGLGGGTGSGAIPVLSRMCAEHQILTVVLCITPDAEPHERMHSTAKEALVETEKWADAIMPVDNFKLQLTFGELELEKCHEQADRLLARSLKASVDVVSSCPKVNLDMNDVRAVLKSNFLNREDKAGLSPEHKGKLTILGTGEGSGPDRIKEALREIANSPLLLRNSILGARRILFQLLYAKDSENPPVARDFNQIKRLLKMEAGTQVDFTLGGGPTEEITDDTVRLTIIATGFEEPPSEVFEQEVALRDYDAEAPEKVHLVEDLEEMQMPQPKLKLPGAERVVRMPQLVDQENAPASPAAEPAPTIRAAASKVKTRTSVAAEESLFAQAEQAEEPNLEPEVVPVADAQAADDPNAPAWKRYQK